MAGNSISVLKAVSIMSIAQNDSYYYKVEPVWLSG